MAAKQSSRTYEPVSQASHREALSKQMVKGKTRVLSYTHMLESPLLRSQTIWKFAILIWGQKMFFHWFFVVPSNVRLRLCPSPSVRPFDCLRMCNVCICHLDSVSVSRCCIIASYRELKNIESDNNWTNGKNEVCECFCAHARHWYASLYIHRTLRKPPNGGY